MATITSTAAGGNWGDGGAWVGGTVPASGDAVVIATTGGNAVTVDGSYPASGAGFAGITVNSDATLTFNTGGLLKLNGDVTCTVNGTLNIGAVDAGISAALTFTPASDGGSGLVLNGTATIVGLTKDAYRLLAADIGQWSTGGDVATTGGNITSITLDQAPSGWADGDLLVIAPTGKTYSHWDTCLLNGTPASASVTVDGWNGSAPTYTSNDGAAGKSAWNHQGEGSPTLARAEVMNLTRSIRIYSTDSSKRAYVSVGATATVRMDYVECYNIGYNGAGKYGVTLATTTGSYTATGTVVHNSNRNGWNIAGLTSGAIAATDCIAWNCVSHCYTSSALSTSGGGSNTWTNCVMGYATGSTQYGWNINDVGSSFPACRSVGNNAIGFYISEQSKYANGALSNTVSHSNGSRGFDLYYAWNNPQSKPTSILTWRNVSPGLVANTGYGRLNIGAYTSFGNGSTAGVWVNQGQIMAFDSIDCQADSGFDPSAAYLCAYGGAPTIINGGAIRGGGYLYSGDVVLNNVAYADFATPLYNYQEGDAGGLVAWRFNQTENDHRGYYKLGTILSNTSTRRSASGLSWQFLPIGGVSAWFRLTQGSRFTFRAFAQADKAITLSAWVRKDASYNGANAPRIIVYGGVLQGIAADVVGDSLTAEADTWQKLSVSVTPTESGVLEYTVEGQGTAGSYYVDDLRGRADDAFGISGFAAYKPMVITGT